MKSRALFLDRDGTLVHPRRYPSRPQDLRLYDGIGPGLRTLQEAGFRLVIITNQAGIARGYFTEADLQRMHEYLAEELSQLGVRLDAVYYCPHHPQGVIPELAVRCDCRKPQPGMLLRAATELDLDLSSSWFVGDILDDIEAGNRAGCRTILVDLGTEQLPEQQIRFPHFVAQDTPHALRIIVECEFVERESLGDSHWIHPTRHVACEQLGPPPDLLYRPPTWQSVTLAEPAHPTTYPSDLKCSGVPCGRQAGQERNA